MAVYPFSKRVRAGRLQDELTTALGVGVVAYINTSDESPFAGEIHTTRDLTAPEIATGTDVVQAHDYTEPDGDAASIKALRNAALPLVGRTLQSLTAGEARTLTAVALAMLGLVGPGLVVRVPPDNF